MDTTAQVITPSDSTDAHVASALTGCDSSVSGGFDINGFASKNAKALFWSTVVMAGVLVLLIILMLFDRLHFGKSTFSSYSSSFVPKGIVGAKQGFNNWYMQDGNAGYGSSVDIGPGSKSLGFGISDFDPKKSNFGPLPGVRQNMAVSGADQSQAVADLLQKSKMEAAKREHMQNCHSHMEPNKQENMRHYHSHMEPKREHMTPEQQKAQETAMQAYAAARTMDEVGGRQNRVLAGCANPWDPMATEEAKVLGAVGVYKPNTPGMSSFARAVNDNVPLTDAQLEAIMQGGEPYTIAPAGINDSEALAAQQRQQQIMSPQRVFV